MSSLANPKTWYATLEGRVAILATLSITASLCLSIFGRHDLQSLPLLLAYVGGGAPLVIGLLRKALAFEFGADLLAAVSIITAAFLGEYLAGVFVILMLSSGAAVETYAMKRASAVLDALSRRMPHSARRRTSDRTEIISLSDLKIGDRIEIPPHDIAPVDGRVIEGNTSMDESYLTGEPFRVRKAPGSAVLSGTINGESLIVVEATALPNDSRYQKIAQVLEAHANRQVPMRRLGDTLGAWYTPLALFIAGGTWLLTGEPTRFLAVLVVATPCPLLIAIPVAIVGAISNAAKRGIVIKNPASLELISSCTTMILDKTGTLTHGKPEVTHVEAAAPFTSGEVLPLVAALELYSKHPLAEAIVRAAGDTALHSHHVESVSEQPGGGLTGVVKGSTVRIIGRSQANALGLQLPSARAGLECVVLLDGALAAIIHFQDTPRPESRGFVAHLRPEHGISTVTILSGDREVEVQHLSMLVGITDAHGELSPEEKLRRVVEATRRAPTLYIGDGINDAPALQAATVGIALGTKSDITSEASDVVVLDQSLGKVDELIHIARRLRTIALESALGGMSLSLIAMGIAAAGGITPVAGAILQEGIDLLAVLNALRTLGSGLHDKDEFGRFSTPLSHNAREQA